MNGSHVKWHSKPKSTQQRGPRAIAGWIKKCHEELVPYSPNNLPPGGFRKVLCPMSALVGLSFFQVVSDQRMLGADVYYARKFPHDQEKMAD